MVIGKHIWGLKVVFYLVLGGVGSGAIGSTAFLNLAYGPEYAQIGNIGAWVGLSTVVTGSLLLLADLGISSRAWRVVCNRGSMLSIGSIILSLFLLLAAACAFFGDSAFPWYKNHTVSQALGIPGIVLAFATTTYTGLLLGMVKSRPFWNTPLLPILWVVSSLSAGIATVTLTGAFFAANAGWEKVVPLERLEIYLLATELLMVGFYLLIMHNSTPVAARSVRLLVRGKLSLIFWIGLIGLGLVLPLIFYARSPGGVMTVIAAFLVLVGAFSLRFTFLFAGLRTLVPGESMEHGYL